MIEFSISKQNYETCIKGDRRFLIADNKELSIQKGDTIRHFETDFEELDTGLWFDAKVVFVTNYEQKENFVVYQFEVVNSGVKKTTGSEKQTEPKRRTRKG